MSCVHSTIMHDTCCCVTRRPGQCAACQPCGCDILPTTGASGATLTAWRGAGGRGSGIRRGPQRPVIGDTVRGRRRVRRASAQGTSEASAPRRHVPRLNFSRSRPVSPSASLPSMVRLLWKQRRTSAVVVAVAVFVGGTSYSHIYDLGRTHAQDGTAARLLPLSVDSVILPASLVLLHESRNGRPAPRLAQVMLWAGLAATVAANTVAANGPYVPSSARPRTSLWLPG